VDLWKTRGCPTWLSASAPTTAIFTLVDAPAVIELARGPVGTQGNKTFFFLVQSETTRGVGQPQVGEVGAGEAQKTFPLKEKKQTPKPESAAPNASLSRQGSPRSMAGPRIGVRGGFFVLRLKTRKRNSTYAVCLACGN
jgi:hypothetical protein